MPRLLSATMLAGALMLGTAAADEPAQDAPPTAPPGEAATTAPAKAPVFLTIVPEGESVRSVTVEEARAREQQAQDEKAREGIMATVQNLKRIGLFAAQFILALLAAGAAGGLVAALVAWVRSRRRPTGDLD